MSKQSHLVKHYVLAQNDLEISRKNGNHEGYILHKGKSDGLELACAIMGIEPAAHKAWAAISGMLSEGSVPLSEMMSVINAFLGEK